MADNYRTEYERGVHNRIIAFLNEMMEASEYMIKCASTNDGKGVSDLKMHERALVLVEMQSDIIDYLAEYSGENDETILMQLEISSEGNMM